MNVFLTTERGYLLLWQGHGRNALILQFVYIAHDLLKGLLVGFTIYSLDLLGHKRAMN